ncbi:general secretion pathway protein GspB [Scleromatobacter humisilvae]|uniref:General secretion pathway protein GspB n=1 Tax=Scleromatobacter humisilvae TaxID=2897159 RepID=A0A9X1YLT5_9BURK|nr:general secretion pathway protein GspB [Scleromatobacter humisilvae]MCK9688122.1 general secretion pathway protein GspB [Scleromatobacter humisilvae]
MSYILDALRRADAERSRGVVPGLHAQGVPADAEPAARNYAPLAWAAGIAGVLLAGGVAVLLWAPWNAKPAPDARLMPAPEMALASRDNAPVQPAQGELAPAQPGAIDPGARPIEPPLGRGNPAPPAADVRPPAAYPPPATARAQTRDARDTLAERAAAGRVATLQPRADQRQSAVAPTTSPMPTQPPVEHYGAAVDPAPAAAKNTAVANINTLPPDVRAQLPHLAVGGAIYSETPSARMVILNGQVFHEGDKPAADTVLEQIRLKSAVLNFRGQRYEISF